MNLKLWNYPIGSLLMYDSENQSISYTVKDTQTLVIKKRKLCDLVFDNYLGYTFGLSVFGWYNTTGILSLHSVVGFK